MKVSLYIAYIVGRPLYVFVADEERLYGRDLRALIARLNGTIAQDVHVERMFTMKPEHAITGLPLDRCLPDMVEIPIVDSVNPPSGHLPDANAEAIGDGVWKVTDLKGAAYTVVAHRHVIEPADAKKEPS